MSSRRSYHLRLILSPLHHAHSPESAIVIFNAFITLKTGLSKTHQYKSIPEMFIFNFPHSSPKNHPLKFIG